MEDTSLERFEYLLTKEPTNSQLEDMYVWLVLECLNEHFPDNSNFTHIKDMLKNSALAWWKSSVNTDGLKRPLDNELSKALYWNFQNLKLEDFYHIGAYSKIELINTVAWTLACLSNMSSNLQVKFNNDKRTMLIALCRNLATIASRSALWGYSFEEKRQYMINLTKPKEYCGFTSEDRERWRQQKCKEDAEYEDYQRTFRESQEKAANATYNSNYRKGLDNIKKNGVSKSGMRY